MNSVNPENSGMVNSMIIEGFICPECQIDMTSVEMLQAHFELVHLNNKTSNESSRNQDINYSDTNKSTFYNVFAKAKTLISTSSNPFLIENEPNHQTNSLNNPSYQAQTSSLNPTSFFSNAYFKDFFNSNQLDGTFIVHTSYFRQMREQAIGRFVIQTNKSLITLDKLISIDLDAFSDKSKRENHYRSIVPWIQDIDVKLCPNCAKSFNLLNRKHHCRLCGAIMCNKCSQFISFTLAKQLTDPNSFIESLNSNSNQQEFRLKRSESITSVNSYFFKSSSTTSKNEEHNLNSKTKISPDQIYLRLCMDCSYLLEKKYVSLKDNMSRPVFLDIYDELHSCISESKRLYPIYTKMAESLNLGETVHQLNNAEEMRTKLIKLFQKIEKLSGTMLKNGLNSSEQKSDFDACDYKDLSKDQLKLQRNIRMFAINYLKDYSFNLSKLPTSEIYQKLKDERKVYLQEEMNRIKFEQLRHEQEVNKEVIRRQLKEQNKQNQKSNSSNQQLTGNEKPNTRLITIDNSNGWIATARPNINNEYNVEDLTSEKNSLDEKDNALKIQIQLVESYLEEALKHNKYDEADLLQKNLNELLNTLVNK